MGFNWSLWNKRIVYHKSDFFGAFKDTLFLTLCPINRNSLFYDKNYKYFWKKKLIHDICCWMVSLSLGQSNCFTVF